MVDHLKSIYNSCDPKKPAAEACYLDCALARDSSALTREFQRRLELQEDGYLTFLFSGHIGCGKSSELAALKRTLTAPTSDQARFFPILLDVSDYLDDYDVHLTDILLAIVTELAAELRKELGIEIKDGYFSKRFQEFKELGLSDVVLESGEVSGGPVKAKIQLLKRDPEARKKVRDALQPHMTTMLEAINLLFAKARLAVKTARHEQGIKPFTDIVLIVDNLEKIRKFEGLQDQLASQRELFLERYTQMTGLDIHVIYTVPLQLVRSVHAPQLAQRYNEPFVLPMVKIMERGTRVPYPIGHEFLANILRMRLGTVPLTDAFTPEAVNALIEFSGGHMRNLMMFVQGACAYASGLPMSIASVYKAVEQTYRTFSTAIPDAHWDKLAQLELTLNQKIPNGDPDYLMMLENLSVLEYLNGDSVKTRSGFATPWYAVNPIVRELEQFTSAVDALRQQAEEMNF